MKYLRHEAPAEPIAEATGWSEADLATFKAFGVTPPRAGAPIAPEGTA